MSKDTQQQIDKLANISLNPAFPCSNSSDQWGGMSLRTYIATQCLAGLLADPNERGSFVDYAKTAVQTADALIEELNK